MSIYDLMHDSQNEADRNPETFFKKVEVKIDPISHQIQLEEYQRQIISVQKVPESALGKNNLSHNP